MVRPLLAVCAAIWLVCYATAILAVAGATTVVVGVFTLVLVGLWLLVWRQLRSYVSASLADDLLDIDRS